MALILVIEDELILGQQISRSLAASGHEPRVATTGADGLAAAAEFRPDLVLLDLRLPDRSGLEVLREFREFDPGLPVVMMTAFGSVRDAVEAIRLGAVDFLQKPLDLDELGFLIERTLVQQKRARELDYLRDRERLLPEGVIGRDHRLLAIFEQAERLRRVGLSPGKRPTILLTGETGTGKGVVARAIHQLLGDGPFIELNCSSIPGTLVEAELFGHERGSFTGAHATRPGLFEAAEGGTIFLDEIGELPSELQAKFLGVIEEKRIRRIGSSRDRAVDVHIVAATHRDLEGAVEAGSFRADLFHRLQVLAFEIPPLRSRPDDLLELARHFCAELGNRYDGQPRRITPAAEAVLAEYTWPGNVRELRNVIERAILLERSDELGPQALGRLGGAVDTTSCPVELPPAGVNLVALERDLIRQALDRAKGNRTQAAALLGLSRDTLRYRLEKYELE